MAATDYDFNVTRTQIINRALRRIGALALGETMTADEESAAIEALNSMVKAWEARKTFLWKTIEFTIPLVSGTSFYTIPNTTALATVDYGFLISPEGYKTYVDRVTKASFFSIRESEATGNPTVFCYDKTLIHVWPTPNDATTNDFYGIGTEKMKDWEVAGTVSEFPTKWIEPLVFGLASRLATEYGLPINERQVLENDFEKAFRIARSVSDDTEDVPRTFGAFRNERGYR